ncbi:unnamed protein product, partial [Discosporangium mesarthrocarpum]
MKKLQHQNVVRLFEVIDSPTHNHMFLVLEYVAGGSSMEFNHHKDVYASRHTGGTFPHPRAARLLTDVLCGLEFLHLNRICHRDIKPENVLIGEDGRGKLGDFGVARELPCSG